MHLGVLIIAVLVNAEVKEEKKRKNLACICTECILTRKLTYRQRKIAALTLIRYVFNLKISCIQHTPLKLTD